MSYATGTTHFNLPQTVASDKRDWSDTNQAFADVDAALYQAGQDAGTALTSAQAAQTTADGAVTTAQSAVTTANGASATAQTASETAQLANNAAQAAQSTADGAVSTANTASTTAQAAQTTASNADTVALRAEGKADTANGNIGTMANLNTQDKTSLVAAINEVLSQIGGAMRCAKFSTYQLTNTDKSVTVDISDLNLSSAEDYMVIFDCQGHSISTSTSTTGAGSVSLTAKTATSFTITSRTVMTVEGSYQVIVFG